MSRADTETRSVYLICLIWRSLSDRRKYARLCLMYKIDRRLVAIERDKKLVPPKKKNTRHSHARAYQVPSCRTERRRMPFFPRTFRDWNALPPGNVKVESLDVPGDTDQL